MGTEHEESPGSTQAPRDDSAGVMQRPSAPRQHPANHLIHSTSPYLLQHAHNPVEWYPWGGEALERARREDKPIFLSIGYAACHWCHVMEREVFEKEEIARIMNAHFINIKVDREERPDLDELYMLATQIMSGSGGWPMSVWLTPDLKPFYAGTYFPPEDGYGRPGFPRLESTLADAWRKRRGDLLAQADKVVEAIRMHADETAAPPTESAAALSTPELLSLGLERLGEQFDEIHGGLGTAPKFPPHQALLLWTTLLAEADAPVRINAHLLTRTLDGMMRGGIYDHVGGGFARYSTDERWLVPHFEKMLYDSAQLAPVYALASVMLNRPDYARVARETLDFFLREMVYEGAKNGAAGGANPGAFPPGGSGGGGAFFSSLDADSDGEEGLYYVWTADDIRAAVGNESDARLLLEYFDLPEGGGGNWRESPVAGASVLALAADEVMLARRRGVDPAALRRRLDGLLQEMRAFRARRTRPGLDDKILTAWNGLMISALAIGGRVLREPRYLEAAHRAIGFLLTRHMDGGRRLLRVSRNGAAHTDAYLDDHAYLLNGLMDLIDSTLPTSLPGTMARKRALELADTLIAEFEDKAHGGFFFTSARHETLFARMKNAADNATPSANGVAIRALLRLARVSGKEPYREVALRAAAAFAAHIQRRPEYFATILLALAEEDAHRRAGPHAVGLVAPALPPLPAAAARMAEEAPESAVLRLAILSAPPARAGEAFELRVRVTIAPGYHIQSHAPQDREVYATMARLRGAAELASQEWAYPAPQSLSAASTGGGKGFAGTVEFICRGTVAAKTAAGRYPMRVTLLAQACTETECLAPERVGADFVLEVVA